MNTKIVPVNHQYAVIVDDSKWRRFHFKKDALQFANDLRRDPVIFRPDLEVMKHKAHCKRCGAQFEYIAGVKNSTTGGYPDFNEWPKCPECMSFTETLYD